VNDVTTTAVVWDMGGIMYRYFTEILVERSTQERWPQVPLGPTGPLPDPEYAAMDAGEILERDYLAVVRRRLAATGVDVDPITEIDWSQQARASTWSLIRALHGAGHPQALLTNDASKWLGERWWETWEPVAWFDDVIDVVTVGVRKPAPEPYLAAAEALQLPPSACLFVDDMRVNCAGAEAVGMGSHLFDVRDPEGSIATLASRLGITLPSGA
jgi:putative hydrolase of the HAD superfamily